MAQWVRARAILTGDQSVMLSAHVKEVTTTCASSSTESGASFWPLLISHSVKGFGGAIMLVWLVFGLGYGVLLFS